jgi:hypothetical protein
MNALMTALALAAALTSTLSAAPHETHGVQAAGAVAEAPAVPAPVTARLQGVSIVFSCVLQVEESEKAAVQVIARAESLGGWFNRRSKEVLELRVPSAQADTFIGSLAGLGVLMDRNLSTQSLEGERDELTSRLKARRATLQDYYAMLKESGDSTIFTIQSEIVSLQSEIEETAGQIQKLEDRMAFAEMTVSFRFQERGAPLTTGRSRFDWLNRLDLPTLMGGFDYVRH